MNADFSLLRICNISKNIFIPILILKSKKYTIFIVIIIKIILAMPEQDSTRERKLFNSKGWRLVFLTYVSIN